MKVLKVQWEYVKNVGGRYRDTQTGKYWKKADAHSYLDKVDTITVWAGLAVYAGCIALGLHGVLW